MSIYLPLFKALNQAEVKYVIVGGLATVLHGYPRFTADIDLVINLQQLEAESHKINHLSRRLSDLGDRSEGKAF